MAEHVFAMILSFSRGILKAREFQHEHRWEARVAREYCYELADKTMGVIGYGNIGRQVARRARALDMRVLAVDAQPGPVRRPHDGGVAARPARRPARASRTWS